MSALIKVSLGFSILRRKISMSVVGEAHPFLQMKNIVTYLSFAGGIKNSTPSWKHCRRHWTTEWEVKRASSIQVYLFCSYIVGVLFVGRIWNQVAMERWISIEELVGPRLFTPSWGFLVSKDPGDDDQRFVVVMSPLRSPGQTMSWKTSSPLGWLRCWGTRVSEWSDVELPTLSQLFFGILVAWVEWYCC